MKQLTADSIASLFCGLARHWILVALLCQYESFFRFILKWPRSRRFEIWFQFLCARPLIRDAITTAFLLACVPRVIDWILGPITI